jgi:glutamyl-tRNA reductase
VVIACTASTVIPAAAFGPGADREHGGAASTRRLVIDLGLPRNVDPAVSALPGVELLDLETVRLHAPLEELSAHEDARALVAHAASTFAGDQAVEPAIVALRTHISALVDAEIERSRRRAASPEAAAETEAALRHLAGVLLHEPSTRARDLAAEGRAEEFVAGLDAVYGVRAELGEAVRHSGEASA